jgi:hypothetical protein
MSESIGLRARAYEVGDVVWGSPVQGAALGWWKLWIRCFLLLVGGFWTFGFGLADEGERKVMKCSFKLP